jgi:S1-C subfamily serine protease
MLRPVRFVALSALSALVFMGNLAPAAAQDRRVPSSQAELQLSYAPIVQRVQPAVVNVYAAKMVQNRNPFLDDPIFPPLLRRAGAAARSRCSARSVPA